MKERIAVLGGGSWGATLAAHLAKNGHDVAVWEFMPAVAERLRDTRSLATLPALRLPENVAVTSNIAEAVQGRDAILSVTPSHTVRGTLRAAVAGGLRSGVLVASATKGLETESDLRMSQIIRQEAAQAGDVVVLSGPSHAEEVAVGQPVVLVAASENAAAAKRVQSLFTADLFRVYTSDDPVGVELGGALKNVYAMACGIVDGLKMGDNTKAALMTRGLTEMTRLGQALGARALTFFGLSGLGDLIVTCGSQHSRNRLLGEKVGSGKSLEQALSEMTMVAEGVNAAKSAHHLAKTKGIDMPIVNEIHRVFYEGKSPLASIRDLMTRQVGAEMEGIVR
jgi:glycerol-3-phosphate dehydrogenase (NAD(P)+)